jgi:hypothetical protein
MESEMKTLIALTTFAIASAAEKLFTQKQMALTTASRSSSEATDEIRRYDIDDLILS